MKISLVFRIIALIFLLSFCLSSCSLIKKGETVKFDNGSCLLIAHRGLSGLEIENSAAAFTAAGERSYYGIEADVKRTLDGRYVICHDDDLFKLSGRRVSVESSTLEELQGVPLFNKFGDFFTETRLITLEDYIEICKKYNKTAFLEFKSDFDKEEVEEIVGIITDMDYLEGVTFISFDYDQLMLVRELLPEQSVQLLTTKLSEELINTLINDGVHLSVEHKLIDATVIDAFHNAGLKVNGWTVNNISDAERLVALGVDFITTDILE